VPVETTTSTGAASPYPGLLATRGPVRPLQRGMARTYAP
jgi:hypothetical protein